MFKESPLKIRPFPEFARNKMNVAPRLIAFADEEIPK
jgi:hypothetical protein